jgi:tetratricopeptide (TPR) repeat protein
MSSPDDSAPNPPVVPIPVDPEDFERRRRRITWSVAGAAVAVIASAGYIYKVSVDPIRARESYTTAERLFKSTRYEQAILSLQHAISLKPDLAEAYLLRGRAIVALAKPQDAIADFTKYIELRPQETAGYLERASAYADLERYPKALEDCARLVELDGKLSSAYGLRGNILRRMGEPRRALEDLDRAVELSPDMNHLFERAATLQLLGEHARAIEDLTRVIAFEPSSPQAYFARAKSYRELGDEAAAARDHGTGRVLDGGR